MELFRTLDCVPAIVRDKPRYVGDHVIRHYRPLGLATLLRDLNAEPSTESLTITGGIGTLTMFADGREQWDPSIIAVPIPPPRPAPPELVEARKSTCQQCDSFHDFKCSAAGCGCAGEGKPDLLSSICPLQRWPSIPLPTS